VKSRTIDQSRDLVEEPNRELDQFERDLDSILNDSEVKQRMTDHRMMVQEESSEEDVKPRLRPSTFESIREKTLEESVVPKTPAKTPKYF